MTKAKMNELVLEACATHGASPELTATLDELTKPKVGGSADVNDYTVFDAEGNVTHILCNLYKLWVPITNAEGELNFKVDEKAKNGFYRDCNSGIAQFRTIDKAIKASKNAIMQDVLDEVITGSDAKEAIAELGDTRSNIVVPEDFGFAEKPEA